MRFILGKGLIRSEPLFLVIFPHKTTLFIFFGSFWTHGCLICSTGTPSLSFSYVSLRPGLNCIKERSHSILKEHRYFTKTTLSTSYLWKTENPLFVRKTDNLQLFHTLPYTYPWNIDTFVKPHFFLIKWPLFECRNGCFVREIRRSSFWAPELSFLGLWDDLLKWGVV